MKQNKQAFTLVELIVVIAIIAILGTIAFISLQGYSASSRDSVRISDMSKIRTSLELFNIDAGKYPDPTELQPVTYSGGLAWNQGIFGNSTFMNVDKLDKIPKDPLTEKEYAYSLLNTKQAYEIAGIMEGDDVSIYSPLPLGEGLGVRTNASEKTAKAMISGTYNGLSLRVNANNTSYILAIPSIITSIDLAVESNRGLETIIPAKQLVLEHFKNLPSNYSNSSYNASKEITNTDYEIVKDNDISNIVLFEGDVSELTPTILVTKLQNAYSGTTISLTETITELLQINVTDTLSGDQIDKYGVNFINNHLGGSAVNRIYSTCGGIAHNTTKSYYSAASVLFGISCDTVKKDFTCIDGTWTDLLTSADFTSYPEAECSVEGALNCTYLETPINHGDSLPVFSKDILAWDATESCDDVSGTAICNNGAIDGIDTNIFKYKTCAKGDPLDCDPQTKTIGGHSYDIGQLAHTNTDIKYFDSPESNGIFRYTFNATCNNGEITGTETGPENVSCNTNYAWNGTTQVCEANTQIFTCAEKPINTIWNTVDNYTQTWSGTEWLPMDSTTSYNTTASATSCNYKCEELYHTEDGGNSCITNTGTCTMNNGTGLNTWNGTSRDCTVKTCNIGYYSNAGTSCEPQWSGTSTTGYLFKNSSGVEQYPLSCNDLLVQSTWKNTLIGTPWNGTKFNDGIYWLKPDTNPAFKVYCDMTSDGGGWTVVASDGLNGNTQNLSLMGNIPSSSQAGMVSYFVDGNLKNFSTQIKIVSVTNPTKFLLYNTTLPWLGENISLKNLEYGYLYDSSTGFSGGYYGPHKCNFSIIVLGTGGCTTALNIAYPANGYQLGAIKGYANESYGSGYYSWQFKGNGYYFRLGRTIPSVSHYYDLSIPSYLMIR